MRARAGPALARGSLRADRRPRRRDGDDDPARPAGRGRLPRRALRGPPARAARGAHDLLALTQPGRHRARSTAQYLEAGADIVETNTFNAQAISLADYGLEAHVAYEMNVAAARVAREAVDAHSTRRPGQRRPSSPASIGPTNRTLSLAVDVNDPGKRTHVFADFVAAYREQVRGLVDGGVDLLLVETVFDTLDAQGRALRDRGALRRARARRVPVMVSVTITDRAAARSRARRSRRSGTPSRTPRSSRSGSTARSARRRCARTSRSSRGSRPSSSSCYPNAGLPNAFGGFDETPEIDGRRTSASSPRDGWLNIVGGCCGTTPDAHPRDRRGRAGPRRRARSPQVERAHPPLAASSRSRSAPTTNFIDDRRADERHRLAEVRQAHPRGRLRGRARRRAPAGRGRREHHRRQHGRGDARRRGRR